MMRLHDLLLERGLVSDELLAEVQIAQRERGTDIGATLLRLGVLSETSLLELTSEQLGIPLLDASRAPSAETMREVARSIRCSTSWCVDNQILLWREGDDICIAGPRVHEPWIQEAIEGWRQGSVRQFLASAATVEPILLSLQGLEGFYADAGASDPLRLMALADEAPVVNFVNTVFAEAIAAGASDIHFEPFEDRIVVRYRIDGVLAQRRVASRDVFSAVASRIKLLSSMDIAERRLPQDGRQTIRVAGRDVDVRVSTLPTRWGESIVIRLLGKTREIPELDALGLTAEQVAILTDTTSKPNGLVLLTGPTGSGKTTTVYRLISLLNDGRRKIVTIEDPVEFDVPGVLQMTVRPDISLDFATGLRSVLRQDPDVIFVGEIRDSETATTAVQAALTGHLVISTLHTNSALAAISRLTDLGVEQFLLADVLRATIGQRLVRRVCESCAAPETDPALESQAQEVLPQRLRADHARWRTGVGCAACAHTGFKGRVGVFETVQIDPDLQHAIRARAAESELSALARRQGFTSLLEGGIAKARAGVTTFPEALRVLDAISP